MLKEEDGDDNSYAMQPVCGSQCITYYLALAEKCLPVFRLEHYWKPPWPTNSSEVTHLFNMGLVNKAGFMKEELWT